MLAYERLRDAVVLDVQDQEYKSTVETTQWRDMGAKEFVSSDLVREFSFAEEDANDRRSEITGAVKLVTSLAAVDGLVLMTPALGVRGFGVKMLTVRSVPHNTSVDNATQLLYPPFVMM